MADMTAWLEVKVDPAQAKQALDKGGNDIKTAAKSAEDKAGKSAGISVGGVLQKIGSGVAKALEKSLKAGLAFGVASIAAFIASGTAEAEKFNGALGRVRAAMSEIGETLATKIKIGDSTMYEWADVLAEKLANLDLSRLQKAVDLATTAGRAVKNLFTKSDLDRQGWSDDGGAAVKAELARQAKAKQEQALADSLVNARSGAKSLATKYSMEDAGFINGAPVDALKNRIPELQGVMADIDKSLAGYSGQKSTPELVKKIDELNGLRSTVQGQLSGIAKRFYDDGLAKEDFANRLGELDAKRREVGGTASMSAVGVGVADLPALMADVMGQAEKDRTEQLKRIAEIETERQQLELDEAKKRSSLLVTVQQILSQVQGSPALAY